MITAERPEFIRIIPVGTLHREILSPEPYHDPCESFFETVLAQWTEEKLHVVAWISTNTILWIPDYVPQNSILIITAPTLCWIEQLPVAEGLGDPLPTAADCESYSWGGLYFSQDLLAGFRDLGFRISF